MSDNLYQPPSAPISASGYAVDTGISPLVIQHLVRTQPWVRLVSIAGIIMTCVGLALMLFFPEAFGIKSPGTAGAPAIIPVIVSGLLYIFPLLKLSKYAAVIRRLQHSHSTADLEDALDQQRSFWKFIGVLMLIGIIMFGFALLIGLMVPAPRQ